MLIGFILNIVFNLTLRFLYALENKKRDQALEGKSEEEIEALREESRKQGFENVTDKGNVSLSPRRPFNICSREQVFFRYVL